MIVSGGRERRRGKNCIGLEGIRGEVETSWITARVEVLVVRGAQGEGGERIVMARVWEVGGGKVRFVVTPMFSEFSEIDG